MRISEPKQFLFSGTIAEREHRKWLHATPLENNPYDPTRLATRLARYPSSSTAAGHTILHRSRLVYGIESKNHAPIMVKIWFVILL